MKNEIIKKNDDIIIPEDKFEYLQKELTNIREDFSDNKYIVEARKVLLAGGLRSTIGSYWNAVIDDLRQKVIHRSLDLFNKEIPQRKEIKTYEDFQDFVVDFDLIEGAYKIGIINWEAKKLLHQARETRNIFDGHPDSSDPTLFKVFNMISDCNRYVLSQEYPHSIINVNEYITLMESDNFSTNCIAIEHAFSNLPNIYKNELTNKLFTLYSKENTTTKLKGNIELCFPILWKVLTKEIRQEIGKRFDKIIIEGNKEIIDKSTDLLALVDGLRYVSKASRNIIYEPLITDLEDNLDNWSQEGVIVNKLYRLGSNIPNELLTRYVEAITLTYIGKKGYSYQYNRTNFYSNSAAPLITDIFSNFDNTSSEIFINTIKTNETLQVRIKDVGKLNRLRLLSEILLNKSALRDDLQKYLELVVNDSKTNEFYNSLKN